MTAVLDKLGQLAEELLDYLQPAEARELEHWLKDLEPVQETASREAPTEAIAWLRRMWPEHFSLPFGEHHKTFWAKMFALTPDVKPPAEVDVWSRGGGKTTNCEALSAMIGVRGIRPYGLYVRRTQERADDAVTNIAALLEAQSIADHYPLHARRFIGKFGNPGAWRRNRVRTAGGFTMDALGLDTAARGVKIEADRPSFMVFDDIDELLDGPHITAKKLQIIKHSIIPAGDAKRLAIVMVQNLILTDGIFSRLADGTADFLFDREVSGPIPALEAMKWQWQQDEKTKRRRPVITAGKATWAGQSLETCQKLVDDIGISAFLRECQHSVKSRAEGIALRYEPRRHTIKMDERQVHDLVGLGRVFGGIDFGHWRFGFTLWAVDRNPIVYRIDEYFAQNLEGERNLAERARAIHELCESHGITDKMIPIWGDAANPTDINELNQAWARGWHDDDGKVVKSKLRCVAVARENKIRKTSIDRLNRLLDTNCLKFVELAPYEWRHAMNAGNIEGTPMTGSRLLWEIEHWSFVVPKPGEPQEQDADDDTADGADMLSSARYATMSWWSAAKPELDFGVHKDDVAFPINYEKGVLTEPRHAIDEYKESLGGGRRAPAVTAPRLRGRA